VKKEEKNEQSENTEKNDLTTISRTLSFLAREQKHSYEASPQTVMQLKRVNVLNGQVNTVLHKVNKLSEQMTPFTDMLKDIQEGLKQQRNVADATAGKLEQVEGKMAKIEQIIAVALGKVFAKVDSKTATRTKRSLPPLEPTEDSDCPRVRGASGRGQLEQKRAPSPTSAGDYQGGANRRPSLGKEALQQHLRPPLR